MTNAVVLWRLLDEVSQERIRQDARFGEQNHPDHSPDTDLGAVQQEYAAEADAFKDLNAERVKYGVLSWDGILLEEVFEAVSEVDPAKLRAELVQVAAVAVCWVEAIDRRQTK